MDQSKALTPETLNEDENAYDEEWVIKINTGGEYHLNKYQDWVIQEAIANGNRGIIMFKTFSISIPYIAEHYRIKRFLKGKYQLEESTKEEPRTNL